ncbi:MAG TPA: glycosyltransferase family 4 protein [Roseateles sp.]
MQICAERGPPGLDAGALLQAWPTTVLVAEAAAAAGAAVQVVLHHEQAQQFRQRGVDYHFLPLAGAVPSAALSALLKPAGPDLLHVHGLHFGSLAHTLAGLFPQRPLLLQHHAGRPARRPLGWWRMRRALAPAHGLLFCSAEQARPFARWRLLPRGCRVYEVPESTAVFRPQHPEPRLAGDPALLWVAHLNANKDPLTVLDGLALALPRLPGLQLWMCFRDAPLLAAVQARIARGPLAGRVHLLGPQPAARVEQLMSAADLFVQGSHEEGSGYSLIEALACGLTPVVSDIPSFRALAGGCASARLWPVADAAALADALVAAAAMPAEARCAAALVHFEQQLSPAALGRRLCAVYADALAS